LIIFPTRKNIIKSNKLTCELFKLKNNKIKKKLPYEDIVEIAACLIAILPFNPPTLIIAKQSKNEAIVIREKVMKLN
tara:strand:- start:339 stop:569 length:231 start_codon:yes stop_codon:yes gene_type:complete